MIEDLLKQATDQADAQNAALMRMEGYMIFAGSLMDSQSLGKLIQVMKSDVDPAIQLEAQKLQDIFKIIRERKRREVVKQLGMMVMLVLLTILLMAAMPSHAQDEDPLATNTTQIIEAPATLVSSEPIVTPAPPAETTPEPTPAQPPVVVVQEPTNTNLNQVIGYLVMLVLGGLLAYLHSKDISKLSDTVNIAMNNKLVVDQAHQAYMQSSLTVQNFITLAGGLAGFIGATIPGDDLADKFKKFVDQVKDPTQPATETPQPGQVG